MHFHLHAPAQTSYPSYLLSSGRVHGRRLGRQCSHAGSIPKHCDLRVNWFLVEEKYRFLGNNWFFCQEMAENNRFTNLWSQNRPSPTNMASIEFCLHIGSLPDFKSSSSLQLMQKEYDRIKFPHANICDQEINPSLDRRQGEGGLQFRRLLLLLLPASHYYRGRAENNECLRTCKMRMMTTVVMWCQPWKRFAV